MWMYPSLCYPISSTTKGDIRMDLQYTLEAYAMQLKNVPRTLVAVAGVVQKIMKTLYDVHFPNAENRRPGPNPDCPDSDILTLGWLLEYIGADSEHSGYLRLKAQLQTVFPCLPERSRFNRRRRNLRMPVKSCVGLCGTTFGRRMCLLLILFPSRFATSNVLRLQGLI